MNEDFMLDADFNNFYEDFVGKNKKSNPSTPDQSGNKGFWSQGMVVGESSPATQQPSKGGFFSGLGEFIKSDTGQAVLGGISKGIENQQGGSSLGGGGGSGFENAPNQSQGLSTGAMVGIAIGGLAIVGLAIYFITKK
jgi:hypothetical protein